MKPMTNETGDRRKAERRTKPVERRAEPAQAAMGDRRVVEKRGVAEAMVDALEDILRWEKASERSMRVAMRAAEPPSAPERPN